MTKRIIGKKQNPEGLSEYHHFSYQILKWQWIDGIPNFQTHPYRHDSAGRKLSANFVPSKRRAPGQRANRSAWEGRTLQKAQLSSHLYLHLGGVMTWASATDHSFQNSLSKWNNRKFYQPVNRLLRSTFVCRAAFVSIMAVDGLWMFLSTFEENRS